MNTRPKGGLPIEIENPKQVMAITLRSGKELQGERPKVTKEVDAHFTPQQVNDKVAKKSRNSKYSKEKVVAEEVKKIPPLPFP